MDRIGAWTSVLSGVISMLTDALTRMPWWAWLVSCILLLTVVLGPLLLRMVLDYRLISDLSRRGIEKVGPNTSLAEVSTLVEALRPSGKQRKKS